MTMTMPVPESSPSRSPPPNVRQTAHKAWVGGVLGAASMAAGLALGAMQVIEPQDIVKATGAPVERVEGWFKIGMAVLVSVVGAGAATGMSVYHTRNQVKHD